jgi:hypothetical protein
MIAPAVEILPNGMRSFQKSTLGSSGLLGIAGTLLWTTLLGAGLVALLTCEAPRTPRLVFGLVLFGQVGLHTLYGDESFLYTLHVTTLMVILTAFTALSRWRAAALAIVLLLIPCNLINNAQQFHVALGPELPRIPATRPRYEFAPIRDAVRQPVSEVVQETFRGGPPVVLKSRKMRKWMLILPMLAALEVAAIAAWHWPQLVCLRARAAGDIGPMTGTAGGT